MTTINTIHDLHRILVEHPEWRDELRRILLTKELLELPQRFAEYAKSTDEKLDALIGETRQKHERHFGVEGTHPSEHERHFGVEGTHPSEHEPHRGAQGYVHGEDSPRGRGYHRQRHGPSVRKTLDRNEVAQIADRARRSGAAARHIERLYARFRPRRPDLRSDGPRRE